MILILAAVVCYSGLVFLLGCVTFYLYEVEVIALVKNMDNVVEIYRI
jgi:hypothetical protein